MKFSRTAWNNVIIFSVMAMILTINVVNDRLYPESEGSSVGQERSIITKDGVILTLTIANKVTIERVGKQWQSQPAIMSAQALAQMMLAWQQSSGYLLDSQVVADSAKSIEVQLDIAGITEPQVFVLYPQADQLLIYQKNNKTWLSVAAQIYSQLMPVEVVAF